MTRWIPLLVLFIGTGASSCNIGTPDVPPPATSALPPGSSTGTAAGLHYLVEVEGEGDAGQPLPLVVALHGLGSSPKQFAPLYDHLPTPARVVLAQAPDSTTNGGWSWFLFERGDSDEARLASRILNAAGSVADLLRALPQRYDTVGKPVVTGFSQGGMLSFTLASRFPDLMEASLPVGGTLYDDLYPQASSLPAHLPAIHAFHGATDRVVPIQGARQAIERLGALGFVTTIQEYEHVGHAMSQPMRRDYRDRLCAVLAAMAPAQSPAPSAADPDGQE